MCTTPDIQVMTVEEHNAFSETRKQSMKRAVIMAHAYRCRMCHTSNKIEAYRLADTPTCKLENLEAHIALCESCAERFGKNKLIKL